MGLRWPDSVSTCTDARGLSTPSQRAPSAQPRGSRGHRQPHDRGNQMPSVWPLRFLSTSVGMLCPLALDSSSTCVSISKAAEIALPPQPAPSPDPSPGVPLTNPLLRVVGTVLGQVVQVRLLGAHLVVADVAVSLGDRGKSQPVPSATPPSSARPPFSAPSPRGHQGAGPLTKAGKRVSSTMPKAPRFLKARHSSGKAGLHPTPTLMPHTTPTLVPHPEARTGQSSATTQGALSPGGSLLAVLMTWR